MFTFSGKDLCTYTADDCFCNSRFRYNCMKTTNQLLSTNKLKVTDCSVNTVNPTTTPPPPPPSRGTNVAHATQPYNGNHGSCQNQTKTSCLPRPPYRRGSWVQCQRTRSKHEAGNVGTMLAHRLRRWPNTVRTLVGTDPSWEAMSYRDQIARSGDGITVHGLWIRRSHWCPWFVDQQKPLVSMVCGSAVAIGVHDLWISSSNWCPWFGIRNHWCPWFGIRRHCCPWFGIRRHCCPWFGIRRHCCPWFGIRRHCCPWFWIRSHWCPWFRNYQKALLSMVWDHKPLVSMVW